MSYRQIAPLLCCALAACSPVETPTTDAAMDVSSAPDAVTDAAMASDIGADQAATDSGTSASAVTWLEHVRPIIASRCSSCHRAGEVGPFALDTYDAARTRARSVLAAVESRTMPPWMPMAGCSTFQHDRSLSDAQIDLVRRWVAGGTLEGDPARATMVPTPMTVPFRADMRLTMAAPYVPDFSSSTTMADDYRCFVLARSMTRTVWVTGYDIEPGVRAMVHHANVHAIPAASAAGLTSDPRGYSCFGGAGLSNSRMVGVWVPGTPPAKYPENTGIQINAGEAVVVQMHYYRFMPGAAAPPPDRSSVLFELSPAQPARLAQLTGPGANSFSIPPRTMGYAVNGTWTVPARGTLWGVLPHMHKIGRRISVRIGDTCAVDIPQWDFHWQQAYFYSYNGGIPVAAGTRTSITCEYDNPNSTAVSNGEGSDEEMCGAPFYYTPE
ncbi:MAG: hypothetical protein JNK05_38470 [Myxococcales bacterium]|nr:hypothetical protein [Myxococcales bacterium]